MRSAMGVLAIMKSAFPRWHETSLRNSVVEITEEGVQVWKVYRHGLTSLDYIAFALPDWQTSLSRILEQNAGIDAISDER